MTMPRWAATAGADTTLMSASDGRRTPAIAADVYYIVPEKCTECVGFFDQEQCAAVCPVDCCVPNPDDPESEEQLIAKAQRIHPDRTFEPGFPSRFRKI